MNDNTNCQSSFAHIRQPQAAQSTGTCVHIRKRKFLWIILSTVTSILIALIIILPTTIILTKKVNSTITTIITTTTVTSTITTTTVASSIITTTKKSNECIFTGQIKFFMPITEWICVTAADVNGDSKVDIIMEKYFTTLHIFLNTGNGTFIKQANYSTGDSNYISYITTANLNDDSKLDIIIIKEGESNVGVFLNTGTGMFKPQVIYETKSDSGLRFVTTADVDGDKDVDIIVTSSYKDCIIVLFNTGTGTFDAQVTYSTGLNSFPNIVTTADLNNDDKSDIIVTNSNTSTVGVFFNIDNGTFRDQVIYRTGSGSRPRSVTTADVNGDKKPDIIVANEDGNTVGVFINSGDGTFNDQVTYSTGNDSMPNPVTTADINGDNKLDIIVIVTIDSIRKVGVFLNKGNGTFHNLVIYPTGIRSGDPICFTKHDVDSNGALDSLFAVSDAVDVRRN